MKKIDCKLEERTWKMVLEEFANRLNVTPMEITEPNKSNDISEIRKLYCKLRYEVHMVSYTKIGDEIERAHTTAVRAVGTINFLLCMEIPSIVEMWDKVKDIQGEYIEQKCERWPNGAMQGCNGHTGGAVIWEMKQATQLTIAW